MSTTDELLSRVSLAIEDAFQVTPEQLKSRRRDAPVADARIAFYALAARYTPASRVEIADFVHRTHGACCKGIERARDRVELEMKPNGFAAKYVRASELFKARGAS